MDVPKETLKKFEAKEEHDFENRLMDYLKEKFHEAAKIPNEILRPDVAVQLQRGRSYGLTTEYELAKYLITSWLLGLRFDEEFPEAARILTAPGSSGRLKVDQLSSLTVRILRTLEV